MRFPCDSTAFLLVFVYMLYWIICQPDRRWWDQLEVFQLWLCETYTWTAQTDRETDLQTTVAQRPKSITPVSPWQVYSKSVTCWRGQKSVVSAVLRRFPNSITATSCGLVGRVANKSATSWQMTRLRGSYGETRVIDFGYYRVVHSIVR